MIDHISLAVSDLRRSMVFYDAVFEPLGITRLWTAEGAAGYGYVGADEPFAIKQSPAEESVNQNSRGHVAFSAPSREAVSAFHARALEYGGAGNGLPPAYTQSMGRAISHVRQRSRRLSA
jgi:catechol 2,3-dioxygenase-like lactoylglutathione lyase family enzyme